MTTESVTPVINPAETQYILTRDGKEVKRGSELECLMYQHAHSCYSWDWAVKYEGWKLTPVPMDSAEFEPLSDTDKLAVFMRGQRVNP